MLRSDMSLVPAMVLTHIAGCYPMLNIGKPQKDGNVSGVRISGSPGISGPAGLLTRKKIDREPHLAQKKVDILVILQ